jgi:NitT/TauT family transport system substrate-binding protein
MSWNYDLWRGEMSKNLGFQRKWVLILLGIFTPMLLTACGAVGEQASGKPVTLRMAVLPIVDNLPMYVAQEQGYFEENGVAVEFIPVGSAPERDQVITAGQADGMVNEIVSALFYNRNEVQIQVVRFARVATPEFPHFRILVGPQSDIVDVDGLKGTEIGISEGTIIEYLTDRLLQSEGFSEEEILTVSVPKIDARLSLLNSGELPAAMLPDPLSSLAIQNGGRVILDDTGNTEFSHSVISFRKTVIDENEEAIRGFLAAVERAVDDINQDPDRWNQLLSERKLVPEPLVGSYSIPTFPTASAPDEVLFEDVLSWAMDEGLVDEEVPYNTTVTTAYLP